MTQQRTHKVEVETAQRIDRYLSEIWADLSRSRITKAIKTGQVRVNDHTVKPSALVNVGDEITFITDEPEVAGKKLLVTHSPLDIKYEDDDLMVVNKPQGQVVHPTSQNEGVTLVNDLLGYAEDHHFDLPVGDETFRPGIVHRLDKDTGGLMIVAKSPQAYQTLFEQFQVHDIQRTYLGLVYGAFSEKSGTIDAPIGRDPKQRLRFTAISTGKPAITHFKVLQQYEEGLSLVAFRLETGRTHQIRVHMRYINHPICDDPVYATEYRPRFFTDKGQLLYAQRLAFNHPVTHQPLMIESTLPATFQNVIAQLHPLWTNETD
ncbi:MAG: RluA family pseudouridine synthase [Aerococcus sp.]|nr:RluA family pseudouridine synthase [Aerococcus sp.]